MSTIILLPIDVPVFDPDSISGLVLWFDAQDISTMYQDTGGTTPVTSNNDPVARWDDKKNGDQAVTNGAANTRPTYKTATAINSNPTVFFDNSVAIQGLGASPLTGDPSNAQTVFQVFELTAVPGVSTYYSLWRTKGTGFYQEMLLTGNASYQPYSFKGDHSGPAAGVGVADALDTSPHYISYTYNNADPTVTTNYSFGINGVSKTILTSGNFGSNGSDILSIGSRVSVAGVPNALPMRGHIGELLIYNGVLSAPDIASVEAYLSAKWGI